ncbi:hypothetical protein Tsubulata_013542 [Turnera subulata]|uniref:Uncharacterized protein n=1 Tax=Turnera subulata TaxID=218843 RepID=A0A9Q0JMX7_9ROSI|nr:hypothetical protein Tsubulata_013542 [Turnera subulata]
MWAEDQDSSPPAEADVLTTEVANVNIPDPMQEKIDQHIVVMNSEENSSSSISRSPTTTENCSSTTDESSLLLDSICNDETLLKSLWMDEPPLVDHAASSWNDNNINGAGQASSDKYTNGILSYPSWENDDCTWLLDCQDFGVHDFGFDCFDNMDLNALNTLELGDHKH